MPKNVVIIGAGVAGLTAAHELAERGYRVTVLDKQVDPHRPGEPGVGGLARTQWSRATVVPVRAERAQPQGVEEQAIDCDTSDMRDGPVCVKFTHADIAQWKGTMKSTYPAFHPNWRSGGKGRRGDTHHGWENRDQFLFQPGEPPDQYRDDTWADQLRNLAEHIVTEMRLNPGDTQHLLICGFADTGEFDVDDVFYDENEVALRRAERLKRDLATELIKARDYYRDHHPDEIACRGSVILNPLAIGELPVDAREPRDHRASARVTLLQNWYPGEHGYRFFPRFYRHLFDTMKRTTLFEWREDPSATAISREFGRQSAKRYPKEAQSYKAAMDDVRGRVWHEQPIATARTAYDNLRSVHAHGIALGDHARPEVYPRLRPPSVTEALRTPQMLIDQGFSERDILQMQLKTLQFLTSCADRRATLEDITWIEYMGDISPEAKDALEQWPQALVGMRASAGDAHTIGMISIQMLLDQTFSEGTMVDGTLTGPTSVAWLEPWRDYLETLGVEFILAEVKGLECRDDGSIRPRIPAVEFDDGQLELPRGWPRELARRYTQYKRDQRMLTNLIDEADYFVLAVPIPVAQRWLRDLKKAPPAVLAGWPQQIRWFPRRPPLVEPPDLDLPDDLENPPIVMGDDTGTPDTPLRHFSGIQFYLPFDVSQVPGHVYFPDTAWGLTSISRIQFDQDRPDIRRGYRGMISVDIGNFYGRIEDPLTGELKRAWDYWPSEMADNMWSEIARGLGVDPEAVPIQHMKYHLDQAIVFTSGGTGGGSWMNHTPYLIVRTGEWNAYIDNDEPSLYQSHGPKWVCCGNHTKTFTRLATMESANESARHAVNAILRAEGVGQDVPTWDPAKHEIEDLEFLKRLDQRLIDADLPHFLEILDVGQALGSWADAGNPPSLSMLIDLVLNGATPLGLPADTMTHLQRALGALFGREGA